MAMVKNPIDRKRKTSFLLGMVIMGIATLLVAFAMYMLFTSKIKKLEEETSKIRKNELVLKTAKKAAEEIKEDDFQETKMLVTPATRDVLNDRFTFPIPKDGEEHREKYYAKIDLPAGTILTNGMVYTPDNPEDAKINSTLRFYDIVGISLPANLKEGDVVDIRFLHPSLPDFVVLSKKRVEKADTDTIWLNLNETEIILFSSAMLESYLIKGSKIYATIYTDPGIQEASTITYPINDKLFALLNIAVPEGDRGAGSVFNQIQDLSKQSVNVRAYFPQDYGLSGPDEIMTTLEAGVNKDKSLRERKRSEYIQKEIQKESDD